MKGLCWTSFWDLLYHTLYRRRSATKRCPGPSITLSKTVSPANLSVVCPRGELNRTVCRSLRFRCCRREPPSKGLPSDVFCHKLEFFLRRKNCKQYTPKSLQVEKVGYYHEEIIIGVRNSSDLLFKELNVHVIPQ